MSSRPTVPMYAPDGTLGDVPFDQVSSALRAGGHIGVNMVAPDGTRGVVPAERLQDASKAGGRVIPYDLSNASNQKGVLDTFADDVKSVFSGLWETAKENKFGFSVGTNTPQQEIAQAEAHRATKISENEARKAAGYSAPYRMAAAAAQSIGTNVTGMEQAAAQGNTDAVVGHMLAGQALAAAPLAAEGIAKASSKVASVAAPAIGTALRTEVGTLKPIVKMGAKIAGGAVGHAIEPGIGTIAGYVAGPAIAESVIPERPGVPSAASHIGEAAPAISPPEAAPAEAVASEGRPATWTNERVVQLSTRGNRDAIAQAVRRGLLLPENVRYVMGDADYPGGVSSPRSVTRFSPTGEPITQDEAEQPATIPPEVAQKLAHRFSNSAKIRQQILDLAKEEE